MIAATLDTDADGQLSSEELAAATASLLMLDTNGDGALTPDEWFASPPGEGPKGEGTTDEVAVDRPGPMRHDEDGDGLVSLDEFLAPAIERFQTIDTSDDDFIDQDEALAARPLRPRCCRC